MPDQDTLPAIDWSMAAEFSRHQHLAAMDVLRHVYPLSAVNVFVPIEGGPDAIEFRKQDDTLLAHSYRPLQQVEVLDRGVRTSAPLPYGVEIELAFEYLDYNHQERTKTATRRYVGELSALDHAVMLTAFEGRIDEHAADTPDQRQLKSIGFDPIILEWDSLSDTRSDLRDDVLRQLPIKGHWVDRLTFSRISLFRQQSLPLSDLMPGLLSLVKRCEHPGR
jgi:hypothetical protein